MQIENEDLDKIIITYQSPYDNGFTVLDTDAETWPELMIEFAKTLNKAGFIIPIDIVEKYMYNSIVKEKDRRLETEKLEGQLDLPLE